MIRSSRPSFKHIRRLGLSTLAVFIIMAAGLIPNAQATPGTITGSVVNIRSGPGGNNEVIGTLLKDTRIEILETSGDWNKIKYASIEGWVAREYSSSDQPIINSDKPLSSPANTGRQVQVINGPINSRSGPDASYAKLDKLPDKAIYKVVGEKGDWFQIQLSNGNSAYVAGWLVQEIGSSPSAEVKVPVSSAPTPPTANSNNTSPSVIFNQTAMQFEVPPRIENGRTLVPLRAIFEAMGANVDWNDSTRTVTAQRNGITVILPLGSTSPTVNGQIWQLEVAAKIANNRTLAPLRFVGEAFGGQVNWDAQNRIINIAYTPPKTPVSVTVAEAEVNLREGPGTSNTKIDVASVGERMPVLAEKNGWYQVSRGGRTSWVASWVVEAVSEPAEPTPVEPEKPTPVEPETPTPVDPETPAVVEPEPEPEPQNPSTPEPSNEPENVLHLSRSRDDNGITVTISSRLKMEPQIKESSGSIQYEFTDRPLLGLNYFEEKMDSESLKVKASSQDNNTLITVRLPSDIEYKMSSEDEGKQLIFFIPNYIINMQRSTFGSVGERFIVKTLCPVTSTGKQSGDKLEVILPNLSLKKGSSYNYSSDLVSSMQVEESPGNLADILITFDTKEMSKYNFATSGSNADLNIILMGKSITQPREKLVVLDAGHGGRDPGTCGSQLQEKTVNLAITLKAGELLKQKGIQVEYTRTDDSFIELEEISNIANNFNAALFVSIHANGVAIPDICGTESYFYAPLSNPDLFVQRDERSKLATLLQNELMKNLQRTNRGVKEKNLSVLRNTKMPSALVEIAFISNPTEQALLMNDDFRNKAAQAIANAVEQYMSEI